MADSRIRLRQSEGINYAEADDSSDNGDSDHSDNGDSDHSPPRQRRRVRRPSSSSSDEYDEQSDVSEDEMDATAFYEWMMTDRPYSIDELQRMLRAEYGEEPESNRFNDLVDQLIRAKYQRPADQGVDDWDDPRDATASASEWR